MSLPILLGGVLLAAAIFGATLYSAAQALTSPARLRYAHIALVIGVIAGMSSIQYLAPMAAFAAGLFLMIAASFAMLRETGLSKFLPFIQFIFGIILATGLPFAA